MRSNVMASVVGLWLLTSLASGCVTAKGEVPPPPTAAELRNDGSPEQVAALRKKYRVQLGSERTTIGDAVRFTHALPLRSFLHREVEAYLAADPLAKLVLPPSWLGYASVGSLLVLLLTGLFSIALMLPLPVLGLYSLPATLSALASRRDNVPDWSQSPQFQLASMLYVAGMLGVLGTFGIMGVRAVFQMIQVRDEERAAAVFNANLARRIEDASVKPVVPPAPVPPAPLAVPGAAPEDAGLPAAPDPAPVP